MLFIGLLSFKERRVSESLQERSRAIIKGALTLCCELGQVRVELSLTFSVLTYSLVRNEYI